MRIYIAVMGLILAARAVSAAEPTTYFRANHGVVENSQRLPERLDDANCLAWRAPLDAGHSTPCVVGERVFVTTFDGQQLATVALDARDGHQLWKQVAPAKKIEEYHPTGSPAASTPASDGLRLFVFFGSYGLLCYDLDGRLLWSKPLGPFQDEFGSSSSPVLIDGKLLINEDHDIDSYLLCLDPATGATLWKTPRDGATRSYATPVAWRPGGETQVVVAGALELMGYRLSDGKQLWSKDGLARIVNTTPAVVGKRLYVATWSPGGDTTARIAMEPWTVARDAWDKDKNGKLTRAEVDNKEVIERFFRIDLNQDQALDEQEWNKYALVFERAQNALLVLGPASAGATAAPQVEWEYRKGLPYVPSPLVYRDVVYLVKAGGIVTTLDAATGELFKQARARGAGDYYASPVAADGKVFLVSEPGMISVLRADPKWEVVATHDLAERTTSTPVIDGTRIFFRTEKALYCFHLPKEVTVTTR